MSQDTNDLLRELIRIQSVRTEKETIQYNIGTPLVSSVPMVDNKFILNNPNVNLVFPSSFRIISLKAVAVPTSNAIDFVGSDILNFDIGFDGFFTALGAFVPTYNDVFHLYPLNPCIFLDGQNPRKLICYYKLDINLVSEVYNNVKTIHFKHSNTSENDITYVLYLTLTIQVVEL